MPRTRATRSARPKPRGLPTKTGLAMLAFAALVVPALSVFVTVAAA